MQLFWLFRCLFLYDFVLFGNLELPRFYLLVIEFHYLAKEIIKLLTYMVASHNDFPRMFLPILLPLDKHMADSYFFHIELYSGPELDGFLGCGKLMWMRKWKFGYVRVVLELFCEGVDG